MYDAFIALHALAGVTGFIAAGALVFLPRYAHNRSLFDFYLWSLVALVVFLAGAIAAHWPQLGGTERLTFSALFLLGPYMLYRANEARLVLSGKPGGSATTRPTSSASTTTSRRLRSNLPALGVVRAAPLPYRPC